MKNLTKLGFILLLTVIFSPLHAVDPIEMPIIVTYAEMEGLHPTQIVVDSDENLFFLTSSSNSLRMIPSGGGEPVIVAEFRNKLSMGIDLRDNTIYVGGGSIPRMEKFRLGGSVEAVPGSITSGIIRHIAVDDQGRVFFTTSLSRLKRLDLDGTIETLIIGTSLSSLAVGHGEDATLYLGQYGGLIQTYSPEGPPYTTIAGGGSEVFGSRVIPAMDASLNRHPRNMTVDAQGNIYFIESELHAIRKYTASTNTISLIAGSETAGFAGDGDYAFNGRLSRPFSLAVGPSGNLYVADRENQRIRVIRAPETDISVSLSIRGDASVVGESISYMLTIRNNGPENGSNIHVTDSLPSSVRHVMSLVTSGAGNCSEEGGVVECNIPVLDVGEEATIEIMAEVLPFDTVNRVTVLSHHRDIDLSNNVDSFDFNEPMCEIPVEEEEDVTEEITGETESPIEVPFNKKGRGK
jgi:uncharacterized repeat protein (TIGR01451 family)